MATLWQSSELSSGEDWGGYLAVITAARQPKAPAEALPPTPGQGLSSALYSELLSPLSLLLPHKEEVQHRAGERQMQNLGGGVGCLLLHNRQRADRAGQQVIEVVGQSTG